MSPRKLTADDKVAIVERYREVGQTTSTVAEEYGVSISTISRLLKSELSSEEYDALVRQKRAGGKESKKLSENSKGSIRAQRTVKKGDRKGTVKKGPKTVKRKTGVRKSPSSDEAPSAREARLEVPEVPEAPEALEAAPEPLSAANLPEVVETFEAEPSEAIRPSASVQLASLEDLSSEEDASMETSAPLERKPKKPAPIRRRRRRSSPEESVQLDIPVADSPVIEVAEATVEASSDIAADEDEASLAESEMAETDEITAAELSPEEVFSDEDLSEVDDEFSDDFDEDDDEDDEDDEDDTTSDAFVPTKGFGGEAVEILPIGEADLARMLYLVVDRMAELITCPMREFQDLGQVPSDEENLQTLPIFDNHRIARRFSKRNQRVIKVPDGRLLAKTAPWLEAKGITRCLLDGQVYSLAAQAAFEG